MQKWLIVGILERSQLTAESIAQIESVLDQLKSTGRSLAVVVAVNLNNWELLKPLADQSIPYFIVLTNTVDEFQSELQPLDQIEFERVRSSALHCFTIDRDSAGDLDVEAGVVAVEQSDLLVMFEREDADPTDSAEHRVSQYALAVKTPVYMIGPTSSERSNRLNDIVRNYSLSPDDRQTAVEQPTSPEQIIAQEKRSLSERASRFAPSARTSNLSLILINLSVSLIATLVAMLSIADYLKQSTTVIKLAGLLAVLVLSRRQRRLQYNWVQARSGSEICRAYQGIWYMKRSPIIEPDFDFKDSAELIKAIRILWYQDRSKALDFDQAKQKYLSERLHSQRKYYSDASDHAARWHPILRRLATTLTAIAFVATAGGAIVNWFQSGELVEHKFGKWLAVTLPIFSAALLALIVARDLPRRANRYREMVDHLDESKRRVAAAPSWQSLWRCVADIEQLLAQEVSEWRAKNAVSKK